MVSSSATSPLSRLPSRVSGEIAIAAVQYGDYEQALRTIESGEPESYFGMVQSVDVLSGLVGSRRHLVVSLTARSYRVERGEGLLVGCPEPKIPFAPASVTAFLHARRIVRELRAFRPTHLLLRATGIIAWQCLHYAIKNQVSTLGGFAARFDLPRAPHLRYVANRLVEQLNHPLVYRVGNHRKPATDSMVDHGVAREKSVAWDYEGLRKPEDHPAKSTPRTDPTTVLYVGAMIHAKGLGDLIKATQLLREQGRNIRVLAAGSGADLPTFKALCPAGGPVELLGSISNDRAFQLMQEADLVCVPSRHDFPEGMPLTVTEALASRTPTVASDHPVLKAAFLDGEGVKFFRAADPTDLAKTIAEVLSTRGLYATLSRTAPAAFARVACATTIRDLVGGWAARF